MKTRIVYAVIASAALLSFSFVFNNGKKSHKEIPAKHQPSEPMGGLAIDEIHK
jgi:hypothetical protein